MRDVAVYEAKTRLSEMLAEVQRGEQFTITRHGVPVARLIAVEGASADQAPGSEQCHHVAAVFDALAVLRRGVSLGMPLQEAIQQGRD
jgi:prevent-host-death family protein